MDNLLPTLGAVALLVTLLLRRTHTLGRLAWRSRRNVSLFEVGGLRLCRCRRRRCRGWRVGRHWRGTRHDGHGRTSNGCHGQVHVRRVAREGDSCYSVVRGGSVVPVNLHGSDVVDARARRIGSVVKVAAGGRHPRHEFFLESVGRRHGAAVRGGKAVADQHVVQLVDDLFDAPGTPQRHVTLLHDARHCRRPNHKPHDRHGQQHHQAPQRRGAAAGRVGRGRGGLSICSVTGRKSRPMRVDWQLLWLG
mmetsp:Transcript_11401/g.36230  ORF Transcript_11401/g.36230 Transcript_11401/m.36230 type:complete len:249 (+) Transcript_11401:2055-2801(+)